MSNQIYDRLYDRFLKSNLSKEEFLEREEKLIQTDQDAEYEHFYGQFEEDNE